jgi:hypothetical protein
LQCGSYIFMDADYGKNRDRDGEPTKAFEPSLFVWATVMSCPTDDRAIVDAGFKALAFDSGPPLVYDEPAATYARLRRARPRRRFGRARRQDPADPRPLRPDRQSLRLVCLRARQPRRASLADHRPRRGLLMYAACHIGGRSVRWSVEAERRHPVGLHEPILRADNHALQVCLGDYQPVERIVMMTRQPSSVLRVAPGNWENLEPKLGHRIDY